MIQGADRMLRILRSWTHGSNGHHHGFLAAKAIGKHSRQEALPVGRLTYNTGGNITRGDGGSTPEAEATTPTNHQPNLNGTSRFHPIKKKGSQGNHNQTGTLGAIPTGGSRCNEAWHSIATFEKNQAFGRSHYSKTLFESKDGGVDLSSILAMLTAQARIS